MTQSHNIQKISLCAIAAFTMLMVSNTCIAKPVIKINSIPKLPAPNLLNNADFSKLVNGYPEYWHFSTAMPDLFKSSVTTIGNTKNNCVYVQTPSATMSGYWAQGVSKLQPSTAYYISVKAQIAGGKPLVWLHGTNGEKRWDVYFHLPTSSRLSAVFPSFVKPQYAKGPNPDTWKTYTKRFTTGNKLHRMSVNLGSYFAPGLMYFDNVYLCKADTTINYQISGAPLRSVKLVSSSGKVIKSSKSLGGAKTYKGIARHLDTLKQYTVKVITSKGKHFEQHYPSVTPKSSQRSAAQKPKDVLEATAPQGPEQVPQHPGPWNTIHPNIEKEHSIWKIQGGGLELTLDKKGDIVQTSSARGKQGRVPALVIQNGRDHLKTIKLKNTNKSLNDNTLWIQLDSIANKLSVTEKWVAKHNQISFKVTLRNNSHHQQHLQITANLPLRRKMASQYHIYWNGRNRIISPKIPYTKKFNYITSQMIPLALLWGKTKGIGLGIDPSQLLSYYHPGLSKENGVPVLKYVTRVVVDPGDSTQLHFVMFNFNKSWQELGGIQRYESLFPKVMYPTPGIDPNILKAGGYIMDSVHTRKLGWEEARRLGLGFDWAYAPFQTPGDWYPDARYWKYDKGTNGYRDAHRNSKANKMTLNDYRKVLKNRFTEGRPGYSAMYYWLPYGVDTSLADTIYKADRWQPKPGKLSNIKKGWIKPDANIRYVYPWGNAYAKEIKREIKKIVHNFGVTGFAYDEAYGSQKNYGVGVNHSPGRAWDKHGVYVRGGIALAKLMEYMHSLKGAAGPVGVVANHALTTTVTMHADAGIFEPGIYKSQGRFRGYRYRMGHKPITLWTRFNANLVIDWKHMSRQEIRKAFINLSNYLWLFSLRYGTIPSNITRRGQPLLCKGANIMNKLFKLGWQPMPAVIANQKLWCSRYGQNVSSVIAISNPTKEHIQGKANVATGYLGKGAYLLADYFGKKLASSYTNGITSFNYKLNPKQALAVRPVIAIRSKKNKLSLSGTVSFDLKPIKSGQLKAQFKSSHSGPAQLTFWISPSTTITGITINGVEYKPLLKTTDHVYKLQFALDLFNTITITYQPNVMIKALPKSIANFHYVGKKHSPSCKIFIENNASKLTEDSAEWLSKYFQYWYFRQLHSKSRLMNPDIKKYLKNSMNIPVKHSANVGNNSIVIVGKDAQLQALSDNVFSPIRLLPKQAIVKMNKAKNNIYIRGGSEQAVLAATLKLFNILDKKYIWYGAFGSFVNRKMFAKAGLLGKTLPDENPALVNASVYNN